MKAKTLVRVFLLAPLLFTYAICRIPEMIAVLFIVAAIGYVIIDTGNRIYHVFVPPSPPWYYQIH
jgi:hypothetical protein